MFSQNIRLISGIIGLAVGLLFTLPVLLWQTNASFFQIPQFWAGILACTFCSVFNVTIYNELKGSNDAGAARQISYIYSGVIGAVLLTIFEIINNHVKIQNILELLMAASFISFFIGIMLSLFFSIWFILFAVIEAIFKIKFFSEKFFENDFAQQVFSAILTSIVIIVFWFHVTRAL